MTLAAQVGALCSRYRHIEATRMAGVALCHPGLRVAAVGFAPLADSGGALGVLVTPWFMNLVWLPRPGQGQSLAVGAVRTRVLGGERLDFIGACEERIGAFEACSLFSPMAEFVDQAAALATAAAVLDELRKAPAAPARRGFLSGAWGAAP